ncbi:response regulator [Tistrella mobilis]|uniref:Sensory/regulatory protein RpfC n=1 Tax=Tistrella mobilis TaxID=171437 RepID=A0A162KTC7_9PROT|nr:response regulator [Tistrella mobilis]KYO52038.1 hypothetical protein AUP44_07485 [Tistrella mobilis]
MFMQHWGPLLLPLTQNLGVIALAALAFGAFGQCRLQMSRLTRGIVVGLIFAISALISMAIPVEIAPDIAFDGRAVLVLLSAPFGGPVATLVVGATTVASRLLQGGPIAIPTALSLVVVSLMSVGWWALRRKTGIRMFDLFIAGAVVGVPAMVLIAAIHGLVHDGRLLRQFGPLLVLSGIIATVVLGGLLMVERRRLTAERALASERRRFQAIADNVPGAILQIRLDPGGDIAVLYAGAGIRNLTGGLSPDLICSDPRRLDEMARRDDQRLLPAIRAAIRGDTPPGFGLPFHGRDGVTRWVLLYATTPRPMADGRLIADVLAIDGTGLHRIEQDLRTARASAERANAAKSMFLANMSHELRTPMTGVLGMLDLLAATDLDGRQRRWVTAMRRSAEGLMTLLNDILDLSKVEAGRLVLHEEPVVIGRLLDDVVGLFEGRASQKGLNLSIRRGAAVPETVLADPMRLRQVLMNLVGNAIKFTETGFVEIRVDVKGEGDPPSFLSIAVADTGIGIAADALDAIFQPFVQATDRSDATTAPNDATPPSGTGLGLAISRRLTTAMGGELTVDSLPGVGSVFTIMLPCRTRSGHAAGRERDPDGPARSADRHNAGALMAVPAFKGRRLLIAEDNPVNRELLNEALRRMGFEVAVAEDGAAAVEMSAGTAFDAIVMDMQMPRMDGVTATRRIRARPGENGKVPILALSADAMPENRSRYLDAGINAFVAKPVNWGELRDTLAGLLDDGRPPSGPATQDQPSDDVDRAAPVLDPVRRDEIEKALGAERTRALYGMFAESAASTHEQIAAAATTGDADAWRSALHALKGLAANYGYHRLAAACASLEVGAPDTAAASRLEAEVTAARATVAAG